MKVREGADARGNFDDCSICLGQAKEPLICPKGHVYCKGCIYEFILTQKKQQKAQMEAFLKQEEEDKEKQHESNTTDGLSEIERFEKMEQGITTGTTKSSGFVKPSSSRKRKADPQGEIGPVDGYKAYKTENGSVYLVDEDIVKTTGLSSGKLTKEEKEAKKKFLPSFWIPNMTPESGKDRVKKPDDDVKCPFGNKIKLKHLTPIKYTLTPEAIKNPKLRKERYMCPISKKTLTNGKQVYLIKSTGDVMVADGIKLVLTDGRYAGKKVRKKDIIEFANCGTGFAAAGARTVESRVNPAFTYG